jgi:hypothetical protein
MVNEIIQRILIRFSLTSAELSARTPAEEIIKVDRKSFMVGQVVLTVVLVMRSMMIENT